MVYLYMHSVFDSLASRPKMHSGSSKTGQGVTANGSVSTLQRQQWPKTSLNRQERSSCSSTASCPVFSGRQTDQEENKQPCRPSSISSPILQGSSTGQHGSHPSYCNSIVKLKSSASTLQGSLPSLPGSVRNLKSFSAASALQSSNRSSHSSTTSFRSSSTSFKSSSSSLQSGSSSDNDSWGTNSWSSGATCLLRSSIKQHSEEVFRVRASSSNKPETSTDSDCGFHVKERQQENHKTAEIAPAGRKDSVQSQTSSHCSTVASTASEGIEKKIEARLKFSQFLDEVTCRVLDPESLQAFGAVRKKDGLSSSAQTLLVSCSHSLPSSCQHFWLDSNGNPPPTSKELKKINSDSFGYQWNKYMPTCKILDPIEIPQKVQEETSVMETAGRTYLETDIDSVWREDDHLRKQEEERRNLMVIPETKKCPSTVSNRSETSAKQPNYSISLPRPEKCNMTSSKETQATSYLQEEKENLRKHLSHTTQKLKMLENEFDTTRQYLEKELRQTQEKLDKFIDELHRIQSSYTALQRINQELQNKIHKKTRLYEEEKRALNQEIIILNNHLMEAKITIEKLRKDNDLYRKDCHLAAQLLQCGKSQHRARKVPELPSDFQKRVSSHTEKHGPSRRMGECFTPYSDVVPTTINAKALKKPETRSSCPITCIPGPQSKDTDFLTNNRMDTGGTLHRNVAYKSSDLYCSDTALYCPVVEKHHWEKRPQSVNHLDSDTELFQAQNSTDSIADVDHFQPRFSNTEIPLYEFSARPPPPPRSNSGFSMALDEKGCASNSSLSSSQLALYMDWQGGDYEQKSTPAYDKNSPGFPVLHSLQCMPPSPQKGNSPVFMRTATCGKPYQSHQLTSSYSKGSPDVPRETHLHMPEHINTLPFHIHGHVSPYNFSKQCFAEGPANIKLGTPHKSFQEANNIFHMQTNTHNTAKKVKKEYTDTSRNISLHHNPQEVSNVQHYKSQSPEPQKKTPSHHQTFGSIGLSRKDSLSKAQLYGTLLN